MGQSYANIAFKSTKDGIYLVYTTCINAAAKIAETEKIIMKGTDSIAFFRVVVKNGATCRFSYSADGEKFNEMNDSFQAEAGRWIGAKVGIFCTRQTQTNDSGSADFDWFRVEAMK